MGSGLNVRQSTTDFGCGGGGTHSCEGPLPEVDGRHQRRGRADISRGNDCLGCDAGRCSTAFSLVVQTPSSRTNLIRRQEWKRDSNSSAGQGSSSWLGLALLSDLSTRISGACLPTKASS